MKVRKNGKWKSRLTSLLVCAAVTVTSIQFPATPVKADELSVSPAEAFVLKNGDFSNGKDYWEPYVASWEIGAYDVNADFSWGDGTTDTGSVTANIHAVGNFNEWPDGTQVTTYPSWLISLNQKSVVLYPEVQYRFTVDIESSIERYVNIGIEQADGQWKLWEKDVLLKVGENHLDELVSKVTGTAAFTGNFYIQMGYNRKDLSYSNAYPDHTLKISDVRMEVDGAREKYLLVHDSDFENSSIYTKSDNVDTSRKMAAANVADVGSTADSTYLKYPNLQLTAGQEYRLQFVARADAERNIQVACGGKTVADSVKLKTYTQKYSYTFTADRTEITSLDFLLGNVAGAAAGNVYLDNIGLWSGDTDAALGITFGDSDIKLSSAVLTGVDVKVGEGSAMTFSAAPAAEDKDKWNSGKKLLLINGKIISGDYITMDGDKLLVSTEAFPGIGSYKVSIITEGFEETNQVAVRVLQGNGNLLENGSFEDGMSGWTNYALSGCSAATISTDYVFDENIKWWNPWSWNNEPPYIYTEWQSSLSQKVELERGTTYVVSFVAYSSVDRPIKVILGQETGEYVDISTQPKKYQVEITSYATTGSYDLTFQFGYMQNSTSGLKTPGSAYSENMQEEEVGHHVYMSDIIMVDKQHLPIRRVPIICGVNSGGTYRDSVTPSILGSGTYVSTLYKENDDSDYVKVTGYKMGDTVSEPGDYKIEVISATDPSLKTTKLFTIMTSEVDYSKQYCIIKSRSNGKVLTANGVVDGSAVVQNTYAKGLEQYFTKETVSGSFFVLRNAYCDRVIAVAGESANDAAKIVLEEYNASNKYQQWSLKYCSQGFYALVNRGSGKVIDVPSAATDEGVQMQQYSLNSSNAQQWDLINVDLKALMEENEKPDLSTVDAWKANVLKSPLEEKLTAAGPIYVEWYTGGGIGEVSKYEIVFDGEVQGTVTASKDEIMEYELYSTDVSAHTVAVNAILKNGTKVAGNEREFYVTKKGVGWDTLYRTQDMNLSWYYNWSWTPSAGTDENLPFIPMIWGNWGSEWLADQNNRDTYKCVLGFNEPDFQTQSNVLVGDAIKAWTDFEASGLRLGSPCTAIPAIYTDVAYMQESSKGWFYKFMDAVGDDVDYIVLHDYDESCDAEGFLEMVDKTWEKWHKPIWISEFGVACWTEGKGWDKSKKDKVYEFMKKVIPELDKRAYVERYAWFPFDPNDEWGGASGIFDYDTGKLNELGQLYATLGLPEGYEGTDYDVDLTAGEEVVAVKDITFTAEKTALVVGDTMKIDAKVLPENATNQTIKFTSTNTEVATVNVNTGLVTALAKGSANIVMTSAADKTITKTLTINVSDVKNVEVIGVDITVAKNKLVVGDKTSVTAAVIPTDASDQTLVYSSSNPLVASVSANGEVTALKAGTANIIATAKNGINKFVTIEVADKTPVVTVKAPSKTILVKQTKQAEATVTGSTAAVTWTSSNESAATVSKTGIIKGIAAGKTTITASVGSSKASFVITVKKPTVKWNVSKAPLQLKKSTTAVKAVGLQAEDKIKSYASSNKKIITVSSKGKITAKKVGTAKVTVTTKYGAKATVTITVQKNAVKITSISVNKSSISLKKGKTFQIDTTKKYVTSLYTVKYTVANKKIATVSSKGKITAKKKGTTYVTVKCQNKTKKIKVVVK